MSRGVMDTDDICGRNWKMGDICVRKGRIGEYGKGQVEWGG